MFLPGMEDVSTKSEDHMALHAPSSVARLLAWAQAKTGSNSDSSRLVNLNLST